MEELDLYSFNKFIDEEIAKYRKTIKQLESKYIKAYNEHNEDDMKFYDLQIAHNEREEDTLRYFKYAVNDRYI